MRKIMQWFNLFVIFLVLSLSNDVQAGLIAKYNFNETSGSIAHDSVGSVNGMLSGGTTFVPGAGIQGGAISLDKAKNSFVNMGDNFGFTSGDFSIQVWVKLNANDTTGSTPIAKHHGGIVAGYFLGINDVGDGCSATGKAHFYVGYPCSGVSSITVNDGLWHQLVGIYNSTNQTVSIYVDGQFQASAVGGHAANPTDAPFLVGGVMIPDSSLVGNFTGLIDEVWIYDNALSATDVWLLYSSTRNSQYLGVTAIPDVNGDGVMDQVVLAMKSGNYYLRTIDGATGKQLKQVTLGTMTNIMPSALTAVGTQISVLITKSTGVSVLQLRDNTTLALVKTLTLPK